MRLTIKSYDQPQPAGNDGHQASGAFVLSEDDGGEICTLQLTGPGADASFAAAYLLGASHQPAHVTWKAAVTNSLLEALRERLPGHNPRAQLPAGVELTVNVPPLPTNFTGHGGLLASVAHLTELYNA